MARTDATAAAQTPVRARMRRGRTDAAVRGGHNGAAWTGIGDGPTIAGGMPGRTGQAGQFRLLERFDVPRTIVCSAIGRPQIGQAGSAGGT